MGKGHRLLKKAAAGILMSAAVAGLAGCSLLTPSRADVPPTETRTKLSTPVISQEGVLTVGIAASDAPQVMTDANGQLTGYTVDVALALGEHLGLDVEFVTDASLSEVGGTDEPDIYLGATADDSSSAVSVIGDVLEDAPALFTKSENGVEVAGTLTLADLSGATIAVQEGSTTQDQLTKCGISALQSTFSNVNECLAALASGEVQYAACDATSGGYLSRAYSNIVFAGTIDSITTYGVSVRTVSSELSQAINDALSELSADGTLDAIHATWYGRLPASLADTAISGITTSTERTAIEQAAEAAEQAAIEATATGDESEGSYEESSQE